MGISTCLVDLHLVPDTNLLPWDPHYTQNYLFFSENRDITGWLFGIYFIRYAQEKKPVFA